MLKDITLGQYFPGNSVVHRMDPRVKLIITLVFIVILFMAKGVLAYVGVRRRYFNSGGSGKAQTQLIMRGLKPIYFIVVFTAVLNIFYTPGVVLFSFGF